VNCTNLFDGSVGFGGYRESGFGREGGIEGLMEYAVETLSPAVDTSPGARRERSGLDRTHKHYIGGKQARPDSGYSRAIGDEDAPRGNRKDVRNAVEAARAAQGAWSATPAHGRAQILYYLAENLLASVGPDRPDQEKEEAARAAFRFAGRADKFEGRVHEPPLRGVVYSRYEPIGVIAIVCPDELPLAALVGSVSAAVAMGNAVVVVPSEADPLPAEDLIHVLESSDIPAGVVNIVAGLRPELVETLARHDDVDAIWCFSGDAERVRRLSASNLKQTWTPEPFDWQSAFELPDIFLRHATQVKNVWVPYGD
jgi:aldehyde dehydrogenase (NAD+)